MFSATFFRRTILQGAIAAFFAGLAVSSSAHAQGFTLSGSTYSTDGSQLGVMNAIADANTRGVSNPLIKVPAGTYSWGAGGIGIGINIPVTLVGAGNGTSPATNTIINLTPDAPFNTSGMITINAAALVGNMRINAPAHGNPVPFVTGYVNGWRITGIVYDATGGGGADLGYFCFVSGSTGLIDNCTITGGGGTDELIFTRGPANAWQTAIDPSSGNSNAVYVENCTFKGLGYLCDINANSSAVIRYCTILGSAMKIDGHGMDSNTPDRSCRYIEAYRNDFIGGGQQCFNIRGGTGYFFDNTAPNGMASDTGFLLSNLSGSGPWNNYGTAITAMAVLSGGRLQLTTASPHLLTTGWLVRVSLNGAAAADYSVTVLDGSNFTIVAASPGAFTSGSWWREMTAFDYPTKDQIGRGLDVTTPVNWASQAGNAQSSEPMYLWKNLAGATDGAGTATVDWALTFSNVNSDSQTQYDAQTGTSGSYSMRNMVRANVDYFKQNFGASFDGSGSGGNGVGFGTTAQMNAIHPSLAGVGFWATDQGSWNGSADGRGSGRLYVWSGSAWVLKYQPYAYPHPLRSPIAPSNLTISTP